MFIAYLKAIYKCRSKTNKGQKYFLYLKMKSKALSPKLFLYSLSLTDRHCEYLDKLAGKERNDIHFACIENAADVIDGSEHWVPGIRESLSSNGYNVEPVDLRNWLNRPAELHEKLQSKDVIWVCGGHTYYLRWILKESGADKIIKELVAAGKVYAGWSAGAIVAGPTTKFFNLMGDDPTQAPEIIYEGMGLTDIVIVPHIDNTDFAEGAAAANEQLLHAGFKTIPLKDNQVYVMDGDESAII